MWPSHCVRMLDAMDVNASITQPNTISPEIEEFYAAQINRLIGLGREDLVAELVADYEGLRAERAAASKPTEAGGAADTAVSLAPDREEYYTPESTNSSRRIDRTSLTTSSPSMSRS